jgi:hypothetical protein
MGSSCGQQINDVFDSFVGAMVRGLEATVGSVLRIGSMVKAAVGMGAAGTSWRRNAFQLLSRPELKFQISSARFRRDVLSRFRRCKLSGAMAESRRATSGPLLAAMQQIADWLKKLGMSKYAQRFADNDIDARYPRSCSVSVHGLTAAAGLDGGAAE